jgi:hypothetical protein
VVDDVVGFAVLRRGRGPVRARTVGRHERTPSRGCG